MSTFVLVHGAWQGASTWDLIVPKLQSAGHKVITPVLTGLGEDSSRLSVAVNLDRHIENVAGVLKGENSYSVTLVGHSYAGMVITGTAEGESGRLKRLNLRRRFRFRRRRIGARSSSRSQFRTHFESRLMQRGKVGDCRRAKVYWTSGDYNRATHASMCAGDCVTLVCDASSRKFGCRRMRPQRSRRPSSRLSLRTIRRGSCSNDSGKGPAVSAGIIMSWPPDMIAMWKPRSDLFLSCLPAMQLYPQNHKLNPKS